MRKRIMIALLCISVMAMISACTVPQKAVDDDSTVKPVSDSNDGNTENQDNTPVDNESETIPTEEDTFTAFYSEKAFKLYEDEEYYKVYTQDGFTMYYEVFNTRGERIDFGFYNQSYGFGQEGDLLKVSTFAGTFCSCIKYFDVQNSRVSRFFDTPLAVKNDLVVYGEYQGEDFCFVVQNIFDPTAFYKVVPREFTTDSAGMYEAVFIDDYHIQITHITGEGEKTQIIDIR